MASYAVISGTSVLNIVEWDGTGSWTPPAGTSAVATSDNPAAMTGGTYSGGVFTRPVPPSPAVIFGGQLRARWIMNQANSTVVSGKYSQHTDLTGNGFHLTQSTAARRPAVGSSNGIEGADYISADTPWMFTAADMTVILRGKLGWCYSIFSSRALVAPQSPVQRDPQLITDFAGSVVQLMNTSGYRTSVYDGTNRIDTTPIPMKAYSPYIATMLWTGTSQSARILSSTANAAVGPPGLNAVVTGWALAGTTPYDGIYWEAGILIAAPTTYQVMQLNTYASYTYSGASAI